MNLITNEGLRYYKFGNLQNFNLRHGIFTRHGGVSSGDYATLNVGGNNGDLRENVIENRLRMFTELNRPVNSLYDVWQVHGDKTIVTEQPRPLDKAQKKADAIITRTSGLTLFMRFGDCVPILLYDSKTHAIALIHAGWPGTVAKNVQKTISKMREVYQTDPADIVAGIGPSIGPDHYEVKSDVINKVHKAFGVESEKVLQRRNDCTYLDLWRANKLLLQQSGVSNIEVAEICTACNFKDWFSHRASGGATGRFGALISLD